MTTNRPLRLALGVPFLLASALFVAPGVVLADCAMPPPVGQAALTADIVFVGTVNATTNGNRWAEVAVREVWRGPDMPATVVVQGGPGGNAMTSVDRFFQAGATYVFFPYVDASTGALTDNSCTSTTELTDEVAKLRPADARQPLPSTETAPGGFDVESLLPFGVALAVFAVLLVVGLVARGREAG